MTKQKQLRRGVAWMHEIVRRGAQLFLVLVASATIHALEELNHRKEHDDG